MALQDLNDRKCFEEARCSVEEVRNKDALISKIKGDHDDKQ
jgi:hypothetical protein